MKDSGTLPGLNKAQKEYVCTFVGEWVESLKGHYKQENWYCMAAELAFAASPETEKASFDRRMKEIQESKGEGEHVPFANGQVVDILTRVYGLTHGIKESFYGLALEKLGETGLKGRIPGSVKEVLNAVPDRWDRLLQLGNDSVINGLGSTNRELMADFQQAKTQLTSQWQEEVKTLVTETIVNSEELSKLAKEYYQKTKDEERTPLPSPGHHVSQLFAEKNASKEISRT